jgi:long-subunit acyl-CoA synthetase (AMP-forming)
MKITIFTSGTTKEPKKVYHSDIKKFIENSIIETKLSSSDIVLNVFPQHVIAYYTITSIPALEVGAHLVSMNFDPYQYIKIFKEYKPTFISLIPAHYEILSKTKEWKLLDMSSVRYMVTGSGKVQQTMIDDFRSKGVQTVANWYGMTEMPPPVFVGYNTESFDFKPKKGYSVEFSDDGECIINGFKTGDIFDVKNKKFVSRKAESNGITWKTF